MQNIDLVIERPELMSTRTISVFQVCKLFFFVFVCKHTKTEIISDVE